MKKLEHILDAVLWAVWGLSSAYLIVLSIKNKAPEYEYYKETKVEYVYTDKNGNKANSNYYLAWHHPQASFIIDLWPKKSTICFYDPTYKNSASIKDEYILEYKETIPKSNIKRWRHWISTISILGIFILALAVYFIGGTIRDFILFRKAKSNNEFQSYAYFLFEERKCCTKKAEYGLLSTINPYIRKIGQNEKKYSETFTNLLIRILNIIKQNKTTKIPFYYYYTNDAVQQKEYLKGLSKQWRDNIIYYENQLSINPDNAKIKTLLNEAKESLKIVDEARNTNYVTINIRDNESSAWAVTEVLDKLFIESYGDRVIRFKPYKHNFYNRYFKEEGTIIVNSRIHNTTSTFTFKDRNDSIPGLRITITISCYQGGKEHILWQKELPPKCTYSYTTTDGVGSPDYDSLYENMIKETIRSFPDEIKKL